MMSFYIIFVLLLTTIAQELPGKFKLIRPRARSLSSSPNLWKIPVPYRNYRVNRTSTTTTTTAIPEVERIPIQPKVFSSNENESPFKFIKIEEKPKVVIKKYSKLKRREHSTSTVPTTTTAELDSDESVSSQVESEPNAPEDLEEVEDENQRTGRGASGIDPHHPAIQQLLLNKNTGPAAPIHRISKHAKKDSGLLELDKTLVYVGMIFSWIFWIVVFTTYYTWGQKHGNPVPGKPGFYKNKPVVLNLHGQHGPHFVQTRSGEASWSWSNILRMITTAQEAYDNFDFQSLECQKLAICELDQQVGIKSTFSFLDHLDLMPNQIAKYFCEYKEAIGIESDCKSKYDKCKFSIKELFYE